MKIHYQGWMRHGTACFGTTDVESVADFVQNKYRAGWERLSVTNGEYEEVGRIERRDDGVFVWWGVTP